MELTKGKIISPGSFSFFLGGKLPVLRHGLGVQFAQAVDTAAMLSFAVRCGGHSYEGFSQSASPKDHWAGSDSDTALVFTFRLRAASHRQMT